MYSLPANPNYVKSKTRHKKKKQTERLNFMQFNETKKAALPLFLFYKI